MSGNVDDIRVLVETVENLQASERKLKSRLGVSEQQLASREAEIESLRVLANENTLIREENAHLRNKVRELETTASRAVELGSLGAETQTQVSVKLQAFQRHNRFLQGELAAKESKIRSLQERVDVLMEELHQKERRCTILTEKLRQYTLDDPQSTGSGMHIQVPEEMYSQLKQKVSSQASTIELLQERLEQLQEDHQRRELLVDALQRENASLRGSVSRLISQIHGSSASLVSVVSADELAATTGGHTIDTNGNVSPTTSGSSPRQIHLLQQQDAASRIKAFRMRQQQSGSS